MTAPKHAKHNPRAVRRFRKGRWVDCVICGCGLEQIAADKADAYRAARAHIAALHPVAPAGGDAA